MPTYTLSNVGATIRAEIVRGDDYAFIVSQDDDNGPVNIAGRTYVAQLRDVSGTLIATGTCTIVSAALGKLSVAFSAAQTAALVAGYEYAFAVRETASGVKTELVRADVVVLEPIVS